MKSSAKFLVERLIANGYFLSVRDDEGTIQTKTNHPRTIYSALRDVEESLLVVWQYQEDGPVYYTKVGTARIVLNGSNVEVQDYAEGIVSEVMDDYELVSNLILFTAAPKMLKALQEIQHTIATAKSYGDFAKAWAIANAAITDATHTNGGTDATDV